MSIFKMKFYFNILPRLYISIIIKQLTNTAQVFVRKKGKCTGLLSTLILEKQNELRHDHGWKSWFCSLVIYPFYKKDGNIESESILYQYYYETRNS